MKQNTYDLLAERSVAGALLLGIGWDQLGELETVDVFSEQEREIIRAALDLRDRGEVVGVLPVIDELQREGRLTPVWPSAQEAAYEMSRLMGETPTGVDVAGEARQIVAAARRRQACQDAKKLLSEFNDPTVTPDDLADRAARIAERVRTGQTKSKLPEISLMNVADVEPKEVCWLWPNRIPAGKLTLLCGDPGLGKSHLTMDIAARVSNGWHWPDDPTTSPPGKVIIFSAEDDIADTIRPRLDRSGADVRNVYCLESVQSHDPRTGKLRHAAFSLADHVPLLKDAVEKLGNVRLIIIDPVSSYTGSTDSHKNAEVRTMLAPLVDLAESHGFAILAVTHLSKGAGGKAVYRATGSLAFAAAARAVWMLAKDLDDPGRRLLLPVKCNIAPELSGLAFQIQSDMGGSFVAWEADPVPLTADGYLAEENKRQTKGSSDDDSALAEAVDFVREQLEAGSMLSRDLDEAAKANDIKGKTLERARKQLGCKARKRDDGKWETYLPEQERQNEGQDRQERQGRHLRHEWRLGEDGHSEMESLSPCDVNHREPRRNELLLRADLI